MTNIYELLSASFQSVKRLLVLVYVIAENAANNEAGIKNNKNCLDKNYNIFQTTRFNHTTIFFKLTDWYKLSDIYISHNNCLGHMLIT